MSHHERYKAERLQCFQWGKEIRAKYFQDVASAKEQGKLVAASSLNLPGPLIMGLGDAVWMTGDTYAANVAHNPEFCIKALEAAEARGYARDMCGYFKNDAGSMFYGHYLFGGRYPRPDFCITTQECEARGKWHQVISEYSGCPYFVIEDPIGRFNEAHEAKAEYLAAQYADAIEWMERVTKRKFDDEKFIEGCRNFFRSQRLWAEIMLLQGAIPAPMDVGAKMSVMAVPLLLRQEKIAVDFLKTLKEENEDRVARGVGILATERARLMTDQMPPWTSFRAFRHVERNYGAVWVGMWTYAVAIGSFEVEGERLVPMKTPLELGLPLRTREDGVRALANFTSHYSYLKMYDIEEKIRDIIRFAKQWRVDGVAIHLNRSCPGCSMGNPLLKLTLKEKGIPVTTYEAAGQDPRELNETEIKDIFERFMEVLGLQRLSD